MSNEPTKKVKEMKTNDLDVVLKKLNQERKIISDKGFDHLRNVEVKEAREHGFVLDGLDFAIKTIEEQINKNRQKHTNTR